MQAENPSSMDVKCLNTMKNSGDLLLVKDRSVCILSNVYLADIVLVLMYLEKNALYL